mgnify:CR=1 FL=1
MEKKKLIKIIIIILIIIAIIAAATITVIYFVKSSKLDYQILDIEDYNYSIFFRDNKYGVINKEGEIIVEPTYTNVQIPNPSKPLFICISEYNQELGEYENKVLNENKEQILTTYDRISAIPVVSTDTSVPYEKSVLKYKKDNKYGLIDFDGNELTEPIYDEITGLDYKEGTLLVKIDSKYGVININGAEIIDVKYDSISADNYYDAQTKSKKAGFIVSEKTEEGYRYGYINYKGKRILKPEFTKIERVNEIQGDDIYFVAYKNGQAGLMKNNKCLTNYEFESIEYNLSNNLFIAQRNSKKGVMDTNGDIIVNTEYDELSFGGEYINVTKDNELAILDINGNKIQNNDIVSLSKTKDGSFYIAIDNNNLYTVLDNNKNNLLNDKYDYIEYLGKSHFIVSKDRKSGIIDNNNNVLVDIKYNSVISIHDSDLIQAYDAENDETILFNKNFEEINKMKSSEIEVKDSYILMYSDNNFKYYDFNGNEITGKDIYADNNIFAYKQDEKWGFVNKSGQIVVECIYDMVTEVNEYGYAGILKDGKWGSINSNGQVVQEPVYELDDIQPTFIGKFYKIESWTGESCYSDNQIQQEADNEVSETNMQE